MNNCKKSFNINEGIITLLDFINYIVERNEYTRVFTIKALYEKAQKQSYERKLKELKSFLHLTNYYSEKLQNGESITSIYNKVAKKYGLKYISEDEEYYYTDELREKTNSENLHPWTKKE